MTTQRLVNRRVAIKEMGKAGLAIVVFGSAACADDAAVGSTSSTAGVATTVTPATSSATTPSSTSGTTQLATPSSFHRVNLDFVSAYILARAGEAALVDTGVDGSVEAIEAALGEADLGWEGVGHVILTHKHPDHVGSLEAVLGRAVGAAVYAGAADIPAIGSSVEPTPVGDGDLVFGLEIIETPGHTAGHVCVLDSLAGVLLTGDALTGTDGGVDGPDPAFSEDMTVAAESVAKLAGFSYEVALFGHGEPLLEGAAAAVGALATG